MKQLISRRSFLKAAGVTAAAASMAIGAPAASACWFGDKSDVTILYTNDVHTYIDKQSPKLTYAAIADLKQSYQNAGKDVLLVDAGDHVQGTAYGSMDEGASIIKLMNAAGYDVATPGNHEFDYGMDRAKAIMKEADFPYLSCNWVDLRTTLRVLPSVKVFVRGGRRIAFVGVTTPETFTKSTPAYFMDKAQRKYIYDIQGGEDGKKLYDAVQKAIDKAKLLADVVIGLGHLGVDPSSSPWTSEEVIAHTSGFRCLYRRPLPYRNGEQAGAGCFRQGCHPDPDRFLLCQCWRDDHCCGRNHHHQAHPHPRGHGCSASPPCRPAG